MTCNVCGGAGTVDRDGKSYECECALWKRVGAAMPPYVLSARFMPQHLESPLLKCVSKSCFITAAWIDMRAIIKAVMMKHYDKHFRITSDRELRDVFVGNKSRAASEEDAKVVYNSIEDLMGGGDQKGRPSVGPDLVIFRLNELGYKNKAAPGILEEAIGCRLDYGRPTWVVSDLDRPFTTGSFAYSDSVWDTLSTSFIKVHVPRITPRVEPPAPPSKGTRTQRVMDREPEPAPEPDEGPREAPDPPPPRDAAGGRVRQVRSLPDDDAPATGVGMYGSGLKKGRGFGGSSGFGKKSFGGSD